MNWDKFITENRAEIDEFLGPNNPVYTAIALKGRVAKEFKDKERSLDYFGVLMNSGMTQIEQNNFLRKLLIELRENTKHVDGSEDPQMRFGLDSKLLLGKDREIFLEIMESELNG